MRGIFHSELNVNNTYNLFSYNISCCFLALSPKIYYIICRWCKVLVIQLILEVPLYLIMEHEKQLKLYMWKYQGKYTIFALAGDVEGAKKIALEKAGGSLKESVAEVLEKQKPIEYDEDHSFIFEVGAQLIG